MFQNGTVYALLLLDTVLSFFFGVWFYRLLIWYPRGGRVFTGAKSMIGKTGIVIKNDPTYSIVKIDGQTWRAQFLDNQEYNVSDTVVVKSVSGLKVKVIKEGEKHRN
ncbi:MAG: NfeD family protein [Thermoplasmataceae archaeon]